MNGESAKLQKKGKRSMEQWVVLDVLSNHEARFHRACNVSEVPYLCRATTSAEYY
jgi:hypothetical protein